MSKQTLIDENQILQMHEGHARSLLHFFQDGRIDLDLPKDCDKEVRITNALETVSEILDRNIRNRNDQLETIRNEPMDNFINRRIR